MPHRGRAQGPPEIPTRYYALNEYSAPMYPDEGPSTGNRRLSDSQPFDWASSSSSRHRHRGHSSDSTPGRRHHSSGSGRRDRRRRRHDSPDQHQSRSTSPEGSPRRRRRRHSDLGDTTSTSLIRGPDPSDNPSGTGGNDASDKDTTTRGIMQRLAGDKWVKGAEAAVGAAAVELFRSRHAGGSGTWRAVRVATAAFSAAAIETSVDGVFGTNGTRGVAESAAAGLLVNRIVNGSRREERY